MNKKKFIGNKRGIAPLIILLIIGIFLFLLGVAGVFKTSSIIHSIPSWFWYILIAIVVYVIIRKK